MFDFVCPACKSTFEELVSSTADDVACPHCGHATTERCISPVRIDRTAIALTAGASPESIAHFERIHRQQRTIEEKRYAEHGDYGSRPGS